MSLSLRRGLHVVLMLLPTDEKVLHLAQSAVVDGDLGRSGFHSNMIYKKTHFKILESH